MHVPLAHVIWLGSWIIKDELFHQPMYGGRRGMCVYLCVVFRLQEEVELMEDEVRRREGGEEVETDTEMERELYVALF